MLRIAVFVSGRGSNLQAILKNVSHSQNKVEVSAVVGNKPGIGAFDIAKDSKIPTYLVSAMAKEGFLTYTQLAKTFSELNINLIVLAGFLKKIPDEFVDMYPDRIINIHPALLPSFGGKGMYGHFVHEAVYKSSAQISGATVHFVNKVYDEGLIIAQRTVDISRCSSSEEIADEVLKIEHKLLPYVIDKFAQNKVKIRNKRVYIED